MTFCKTDVSKVKSKIISRTMCRFVLAVMLVFLKMIHIKKLSKVKTFLSDYVTALFPCVATQNFRSQGFLPQTKANPRMKRQLVSLLTFRLTPA